MKMKASLALGAGLLAALAVAQPLTAQGPARALLASLDPGLWSLRPRDDASSNEQFCIPDHRRLVQLRHRNYSCTETVVTDEPNNLVVQYTCRGHGYGRTHIRRESDALVQIDTQGIVDGFPFAFTAEARRLGNCAG